MLLLLSPAKSLDFSPVEVAEVTQPRLLDKSEALVGTLRKKSKDDLANLMHISDKLAALNYDRYHQFSTPFTPNNAKPALLAFTGDVYTGIQAEDFDEGDLQFAQRHLRILSGLYGVLRPLDLMQAYRLEMGTRLQNGHGKNLYEFWDTTITEVLNQDIAANEEDFVVNLASQEYFKSVKPNDLEVPVVDVHFKEDRGGKLKVISFTAKRARGAMSRFVIKNKLTSVEELKSFEWEGYAFDEELSSEREMFFVKR